MCKLVKTYLENLCAIYRGVQSGNVCCAKTCGICGGEGCGTRPGGNSNCCKSQIPLDKFCGPQNNAPCHLQNGNCVFK